MQWQVVPFPLVELQSKWVAAVLSGQVALPTQKEMMEDVEALYKEMKIAGLPIRYTHNIGQYQVLPTTYETASFSQVRIFVYWVF